MRLILLGSSMPCSGARPSAGSGRFRWNAVEQTNKEITNRFDFKSSDAHVEQAKLDLTVFVDDEFKLGQVMCLPMVKAWSSQCRFSSTRVAPGRSAESFAVPLKRLERPQLAEPCARHAVVAHAHLAPQPISL